MERKKSYILVLFLIFAFPLGILVLGLYCCSYKRGFTVDKISSKLHHNEMWETKALSLEENKRLIKEILSQTFYYYGSGNQCYSFVSQDDKYVIKFFKMHKILPKNWLMDFPFSLFEKYRLDNVEKKRDVFEMFFNSFKHAYENLREECGLIYVHLNKTRDIKTKIALIGYDGKKIWIDLDSKEFVVQLKAEKFTEYLLQLKENANEEKIRFAVKSFFEVIAKRCQMGYGDQSMGIRNNFGFVNGRAVLMDCSHLFVDISLKLPQYFQNEVLRIAENLSHWAEQFYPDLSILLEEEAQAVLDKCLKLI